MSAVTCCGVWGCGGLVVFVCISRVVLLRFACLSSFFLFCMSWLSCSAFEVSARDWALSNRLCSHQVVSCSLSMTWLMRWACVMRVLPSVHSSGLTVGWRVLLDAFPRGSRVKSISSFSCVLWDGWSLSLSVVLSNLLSCVFILSCILLFTASQNMVQSVHTIGDRDVYGMSRRLHVKQSASSSVYVKYVSRALCCEARKRWVRLAPFGLPELPVVKVMSAVSSPLTGSICVSGSHARRAAISAV